MPRFLSPYRVLFRMPGAAQFFVSGLLARLGGAMVGVSVIVMISGRRDSYGVAGIVSFAGVLSMAIGGPLVARLVDRYGQRRIVLPTGLFAMACLGGLALLTYLGAPLWALLLINLGQLAAPAISTYLRSRWVYVLGEDRAALHTATSFESAAEEGCFMVGPVLAALLATVFPELGLLVAAALGTLGTIGLMTHRRSEPPVQPASERHSGLAVRAPGLAGLAVTVALTGTIFGSLDVVVLAFAEAEGAQRWGGVVLGIFAAGSLIGGLLYGLLPSTGPLAGRVRIATFLMFLMLSPTLLAPDLSVLAVIAVVAGLAISPLMITSMLLAQRLVPPSQMNEGMTVVVTGILVGVGVGSGLAGNVVEGHGADRGFIVPVAAAGLAFLLALVWRASLSRAELAGSERWTIEPERQADATEAAEPVVAAVAAGASGLAESPSGSLAAPDVR